MQEKEASANISIIVKRDNDLSPTLGERHRTPSGSGSSAGKLPLYQVEHCVPLNHLIAGLAWSSET